MIHPLALYEGAGANKIEEVTAEKVIKTLFYSGEKNGHVNWQSFEQTIVKVFNNLNNNSPTGIRMNKDERKIKILCEKTQLCAFLSHVTAVIERNLGKPNTNSLTFEQALAEMHNKVVTLSSNTYAGANA